MGFHDAQSPTVGVDEAFASRWNTGVGVEIMGRNKFVPSRGPWDERWRGWWGDDPPFHTPVVVLTHHPRPVLELDGGNSFHFLDAPPAEALDYARGLAAGGDVRIGGRHHDDPAVPRGRPHRRDARRGGPGPPGQGRAAVGRTGGSRGAVPHRGHCVAQRCHPPEFPARPLTGAWRRVRRVAKRRGAPVTGSVNSSAPASNWSGRWGSSGDSGSRSG